ncbi:MAG: hypothetical protein PF690_03500 [Deltaproteobacteria bacterium]|jgi:hypothetical protein|nr:hypothetical protein [Deltaproteobacteria bacterium]
MKKIKYFLWLIILIALGILIYQNSDYFMAATALKFDLKISSWNWTIPELQNISFFAICFFLGFILAGIKWMMLNFKFKNEFKTKDATISSLKEQLNTFKAKLEVFQHDPYIKKDLEEKAQNSEKESDKIDTPD